MPGARRRLRRAALLKEIADRIDENLELMASVETIDNGKPIRETRLADIPLAADHFRYFAACLRAQEGSLGELDPKLSPITITSRSASWPRSSRGTSRS